MKPYPPYLAPLPYYSLSPQLGVIQRTAQAKQDGKRIVIASGVFDLFHAGHQAYLEAAAKMGDFLVVLVESDARTRELKGEGRPIWGQQQRLDAVRRFPGVNEVLLLPKEFVNPLRYEEIVLLLEPDVYAASSHSVALSHKQKMMQKHGGELAIVLKEIPGISTSSLLEKTP